MKEEAVSPKVSRKVALPMCLVGLGMILVLFLQLILTWMVFLVIRQQDVLIQQQDAPKRCSYIAVSWAEKIAEEAEVGPQLPHLEIHLGRKLN